MAETTAEAAASERATQEGSIVALHVAPAEGAPMVTIEEARAIPGRGLAGDRYEAEIGHYSPRPLPGGARVLTLFEAEVLELLGRDHGIPFAPHEHRRNVTVRGVRLNDLIGKRFYLGDVLCEGVRECTPCTYLEELTGKPVNKPLVGRGGLRANVLTEGVIRVGDRLREVSD